MPTIAFFIISVLLTACSSFIIWRIVRNFSTASCLKKIRMIFLASLYLLSIGGVWHSLVLLMWDMGLSGPDAMALAGMYILCAVFILVSFYISGSMYFYREVAKPVHRIRNTCRAILLFTAVALLLLCLAFPMPASVIALMPFGY